MDELGPRAEAVRAQRGDAHLASRLDQRADQLDHLGMVGDRGADEADPLGGGGNDFEDALGRDGAHAPVGRSPHHAVGAAARAAPLGLDQKHRPQLGVRGHDLGAGGKPVIVGLGHRLERLARPGQQRCVEAGARVQPRQQLVARQPRGQGVEQLVNQLLALAEHEQVREWGQRDRVREGKRPAADDQRLALPALLSVERDAGEREHLEQAGQLELVADRERERFELRDGPLRLEREHRDAGVAVERDRRLVVGQEGPLGGGALVGVDLAVDGLEPERAHADVVGARVAERDAGGRVLPERPFLVGEPAPQGLAELPAILQRGWDAQAQDPDQLVDSTGRP